MFAKGRVSKEGKEMPLFTHLAGPGPCQAVQGCFGRRIGRDIHISPLGVCGANIDDAATAWHVRNNCMNHVKGTKDIKLEHFGQLFDIRLLGDRTDKSRSSIVDCNQVS